MKSPPFGYVRAASLADAFRLLKEHGADAKLLAGGQTLLATLAFRLSEPSVLIDISKVAELRGITRDGDMIRIGAGTPHAVLGEDALVRANAPLLSEAVTHIAHAAIRNRGTIGGSLAYADPAAEFPACCLALEAVIEVQSSAGTRQIAATEFFTGLFSTALEDGEIITAVRVPVAKPNERSVLLEFARRAGDYAMAGLALRADVTGQTLSRPRLAYFGVGDGPVLAQRAATILDGTPLTADRVAAAQKALAEDLDPPADQHGTADMKHHLARTLLARALDQLTQTKATAT